MENIFVFLRFWSAIIPVCFVGMLNSFFILYFFTECIKNIFSAKADSDVDSFRESISTMLKLVTSLTIGGLFLSIVSSGFWHLAVLWLKYL